MAAQASSHLENCPECGEDTPHSVEITLVEESDKGSEHAKFSRQPCRVSECDVCGEQKSKMLKN